MNRTFLLYDLFTIDLLVNYSGFYNKLISEYIMNKFNIKKFGGSIFGGIVTFLICTILSDQIFPWFTAQAVKYSSSFNTLVFISVSNHDLVALQQSTHLLVSIFSFSFFVLLFGGTYLVMLYFRKEYEDSKARLYELQGKVLDTGKVKEKEQITSEKLLQEINDSINDAEKNDKYFSKIFIAAKYFLPVLVILGIYNATYATVTSKYIYESISYFDYLLMVNAASLDEQTERSYMTRFTQIRSSQDYKKIILELEKLALSCGRSIIHNPTVRSLEDIHKDHPKAKTVDTNAN